jgi:predicted nucleic acid-binding protein
MTDLVADTSGLVSLGVDVDGDIEPLGLVLDSYDVRVPAVVLEELETVASFDDDHAVSANAVLERSMDLDVRSVDVDPDFPLDDGENAAVSLANALDAGLCLSDEFTNLGLLHASLANTRLVTTPTLLAALVRRNELDPETACTVLDEIGDVRSWDGNSYVRRARSLLE